MNARRCWYPLCLILATMAALGADCVPKRIFWSPDGQRAIITADEVYMADAQGNLSAALKRTTPQVAWFPDSRRILAQHSEPLHTFAEIEKVLTPQQVAKIKGLAEPVLKEIMAQPGNVDGRKPEAAESLSDREMLALWIHLREGHAAELSTKFGSRWQDLATASLVIPVLQTYELEGNALKPSRVVQRCFYDIADDSLRISPDGYRLAYVLKNGDALTDEQGRHIASEDSGGSLMLVDLKEDEARPREVARLAAWRPDWTPDSRSLVYATTAYAHEKTATLGSIMRREAVDEQEQVELGEPVALAGVIYSPNTKIVCQADGSILFSAVPVTLPASSADPPSGGSLFSLDPQKRATVAPVLTTAAQSAASGGFEAGLFDVRPDGKAVTMLGQQEGDVSYYVFASGVVVDVSPKENWKLLERPAWRNNDELSLVVPAGHPWGSPKRPEVVLYSISTKQPRCISRDWPDDLMQRFVPEQGHHTASATAPE